MASRRALRALLEDVGTQAIPEPRSEFVTGLQTRLLGDVAALPAPTSLVERAQARSRARFVRPMLVSAAAAVAALVLAGSLAGWFGQDEQQRQLALASAVDTIVVLPDGTTIDGHGGLALPDGAIVQTGPNGHAAVGNVDLGPGQQAVVEGGRLQVSTPEPTVPTVVTTLPPVTVPTLPTTPSLPTP